MGLTPELSLAARLACRAVELLADGVGPDDGTPDGKWLARLVHLTQGDEEVTRTRTRLRWSRPDYQRSVMVIRWLRRIEDAAETPQHAGGLRKLLAEVGGDSPADDSDKRRADDVAMSELAYRIGFGTRRSNPENAENSFRHAHELGHPEAANDLGNLLDTAGRTEDALRWWRTSAELGNASAVGNLAALHERRGELDEAEHWWTEARQRGVPDAAQRLAAVQRRKAAEPTVTRSSPSVPQQSQRRRWWWPWSRS